MAALVYIASSGQALGGAAKTAFLVVFTLAFLGAGVICLRFDRVRQAGVVFFAVGALLVPINFVGAYGFIFADNDIDPVGLWLAASLVSLLFYVAVSMLGMGSWYPVPAVIAAYSSLAAVLVALGAPEEAYPPAYIALSVVLSLPWLFALGRVSQAAANIAVIAAIGAHLVVPCAVIAIFILAAAYDGADSGDYELSSRWFLPGTVALGAAFYWLQALVSSRRSPVLSPALTVVALSVSGGALVSIVYAVEAGSQWYGPAIALLGAAYAIGSNAGPLRWPGRAYCGWLALLAVTCSWLPEGLHSEFPKHGAAVHFGAGAFYLAAARLVRGDVALFFTVTSPDAGPRPARLSNSVPLVYAAGLTLGIGYYFLLASLPAAEGAEAAAASWPFFALSVAIAAAAASMRFWWQSMRVHTYAIAAGMSVFVALTSLEAEGAVALLLLLYVAISLALALWEREPIALALPAAYGFAALLAGWRYLDADDAYLPLAISGLGYGLFAAHLLLRGRRLPTSALFDGLVSWPLALRAGAFIYAGAAPIAGWVRLGTLSDSGMLGTERFEETLLYQLAAASVALLALLVIAEAWLQKRIEFAVASSALLMVALLLMVGHFRPANVQAYTLPIGAYVLAGALLALRLQSLPGDLQMFIGPLEAFGAGVIMAPSFEQSLDNDAWVYGAILLAECLAFVSLAIVQRRVWLLGVGLLFVVMNGGHYLFFAQGPALPNWAILALAGAAVMAAGMGILLGRERWTAWQRAVQAWWTRKPVPGLT